jgi:protein N-lysine methyltransferase METTL21A
MTTKASFSLEVMSCDNKKEKYEKKVVTIKYRKLEVHLSLDMNVGIGGEHWPAAHMFSNLITAECYFNFFDELFKDKSIIELGSGTGLVSIVLSKLYQPSSITVTDLSSHIDLIQENVDSNAAVGCICQELDWYRIPEPCPRYDIILAFEW